MMYYILAFIPLILVAIANANVTNTYKKYDKVSTERGMTGAQVARAILDRNNLYHVQITKVSGKLTDHYDPRARVVSLSADVYDSTTISAAGVAAHEVGHAIQHQADYGFLSMRNAIIPISNIVSRFAVPVIFVGLLLEFTPLAFLGVVAFFSIVLVQAITLPVEFDASKRAMQSIADYDILSLDERRGASKVLTAAALTYVVALIVTVIQTLRLLATVLGRRRN